MAMTSLDLRRAIRDKYVWPGGYAIIGITDDGAALCCECMRKEYRQIAYARRHNLRDGWNVVGCSTTEALDDRSDTICDHCGEAIE